MSLNLEQKQAVVAEVAKEVAGAKAIVMAENRGMAVADMTKLRAKARASASETVSDSNIIAFGGQSPCDLLLGSTWEGFRSKVRPHRNASARSRLKAAFFTIDYVGCSEEYVWLELASDWTKLAEAFECEDRLLLN